MIYHFCCFLGGKLMICPIYVSHALLSAQLIVLPLHCLTGQFHLRPIRLSLENGTKLDQNGLIWTWGSILFQRGSKTVWNIIKSNVEHVWTPLKVHTVHTVVVWWCFMSFDIWHPIYEKKECFVNRRSWATLQFFLLHFAWALLSSHPNRVACCKACYSTRLVRYRLNPYNDHWCLSSIMPWRNCYRLHVRKNHLNKWWFQGLHKLPSGNLT